MLSPSDLARANLKPLGLADTECYRKFSKEVKNMIIRATRAIFYKIHKGNARALDYLKWAYRMIEEDQESKSIKYASFNGKVRKHI